MEEMDENGRRLAGRLRQMRLENGLSLDALAQRSGVSRASLSRLENAETSPTAQVLGRLCAVYGLTTSHLLRAVEQDGPALVAAADQPVWTDRANGFVRRGVSPPAAGFAGEVVRCTLRPAADIAYERPPRPGIEHHILLLEGALTYADGGASHELRPGDCLRVRLSGESRFTTPPDRGADYIVFIV